MKSLGILGGGQLAKFLALKAKNLAIKTFILSPSKEDPAAKNNPFWIKGDPHKIKDLKNFFKFVEAVTFESEFFSAKKIQKAEQILEGKGPFIAPSLKNLSLIQDRFSQKKLLTQSKIKTASFIPIKLKKAPLLSKQLSGLWNRLGPFVLKSRTGGYDGYGTFIFQKKAQITQSHQFPSGSFIAEKFIPFKRELAILSARNKQGQVVFFPLVESFQKNSICLWVKGPARHKKLKILKVQIKNFLQEIDYQGLIAFELFDTGKNLIVNELAPRVHNSGHHSLNSLTQDQFTAHLKAVTNQPLTVPKRTGKAFAMLNLLGEGHNIKQNKLKRYENILKQEFKQTHFYWYDKAISRKGRKMGHLNATAHSSKKALDQLLKARKFLKI